MIGEGLTIFQFEFQRFKTKVRIEIVSLLVDDSLIEMPYR